MSEAEKQNFTGRSLSDVCNDKAARERITRLLEGPGLGEKIYQAFFGEAAPAAPRP